MTAGEDGGGECACCGLTFEESELVWFAHRNDVAICGDCIDGLPLRRQGRDRRAAYLHVRGVDDLHEAWAAAGLPVSEVRDEPWDMREYDIVDPGGNVVRVGQNL